MLQLATRSGFVTNLERFAPIPSQPFVFLGMEFDTRSLCLPVRATAKQINPDDSLAVDKGVRHSEGAGLPPLSDGEP